MNNRFVKNNIGLLIVTGLCAVVALVVLVFVIIYSIDMYDNIQKLSDLSASAAIHGRALEKAMEGVKTQKDTLAAARYYCDRVLPAMESLRAVVDEAETRCAARWWPYPSYGEILTSVK